MKQITLALFAGLVGLWLVPAVQAAPVAPELQISVSVANNAVQPGQLVLIHAAGGFPLEVDGTLDGKPLTFFWSGDGYVALIAIELEAQPASQQLLVSAREPSSGRVAEFAGMLTIEEDNYPMEYVNLSGRLVSLLDPALNQAEVERIAALVAPVSPRIDLDLPVHVPVISRITSLYGSKRSYNGDLLEARHTGIDFRMPEGAPVLAASSGRVVVAETFDVRGNVVMIDHGWGVYTQYAHMSALSVSVGDEVLEGQKIGEAGRTGRSTGTHLHWEVIINGVSVDPLFWMALSPNYLQPPIDDAAVTPAS